VSAGLWKVFIRLELLPPFGVGKDRSTDDYTAGWLKFSNSLKSMVEFGNSCQEVQLEPGLPLTVKPQTGHGMAVRTSCPIYLQYRANPYLK
jgi:hypothetical protein